MNRRFTRATTRRLKAAGEDPATAPVHRFDSPDDRHLTSEEDTQVNHANGHAPPTPVYSDLPPRPEKIDPVEGAARAIIPVSLAHPVEAAKAKAERMWQSFAFHGLRAPWYQLEVIGWTPRGLHRIIVGLWSWATDGENAQMRAVARETKDMDRYLMLDEQRDRHVRRRFLPAALLGAAVIGSVALVLAGLFTGVALPLAALAGLILSWVYGRGFGAPEDRAAFPSAVVAGPGVKKITDGMLIRAFIDAGLCKEDRPIDFAQPVTEDLRAKGWHAIVVLPGHKTADEAVKARVKLAAALDVDEARVFPERIRGETGSARRVSLLVTNKDPMAAKPRPTPLLKAKQIDVWKPVPIGMRPNGETFEAAVVGTNILIGGIPGSGKTFTTRLFPAAGALDPTVRLIFADGKGGADLMPFEQVAHWFVAGERGAAVTGLEKMLLGLIDDMEWRYDRLRTFARAGMVRESKITPAIARNPELEMPLVMVVIDEVQTYFDHPQYGEAIKAAIIKLVRQGRAVGITFVLTTQRPDHKTIPTNLRDIIGTRLCHRVDGLTSAKMILGDTLPAGLEPWTIQRHQVGAFYALGADADNKVAQFDHLLVKGDFADDLAITRIVGQARKLREGEGLLTGFAAGEGEIEEETPPELLGDVITVFRPGEKKLWSETLCDRLGDHKPITYSGWTVNTLQKNLATFGVATKDVWSRPDAGGEAKTKKGVELEVVLREHAKQIPDTPEGLT